MARSTKLSQTIAALQPEEKPFEEPRLLDLKAHPDAEAINALTTLSIENGVRSALAVFQTQNPDYKASNEAAVALTQFVSKSKKNPADPKSWADAWEHLKPLLTIPTEISVPAPAPIAEPLAAVAVTTRHAAVSTGLSSMDGGDAYQPAAPLEVGPNQGWTYEKLERLPTEQYKKLARDPKMAQLFDRVLQEHEDKRAVARRGR
jgi:hypothetical protein